MKFLVIDDIVFPGDLLIGLNIMANLKICLDPAKWKVDFNEVDVPFWGVCLGSTTCYSVSKYVQCLESLETNSFLSNFS